MIHMHATDRKIFYISLFAFIDHFGLVRYEVSLVTLCVCQLVSWSVGVKVEIFSLFRGGKCKVLAGSIRILNNQNRLVGVL